VVAPAACAATRRKALQAALLLSQTSCLASALQVAAPLPTPAAPAAPQLQPATPAQRAALDTALKKLVTKPKAPLLLRLLFHDAFTYRPGGGDGGPGGGDGGSNASIQYELERVENAGLKRGWTTVRDVRTLLPCIIALVEQRNAHEAVNARLVSCSALVHLAK
jgi:L-ascorbate peroxidase